MPLTYQEIAEILKILDTSSIDEFVVEVGEFKLAVRRKSATTTDNDGFSQSPKADESVSQPTPRAPSPTVPRQTSTPAQSAEDSGKRGDGLAQVRAPMSGIFYGKPSPDAEPFVSVGSEIKKGDSLCLVEVMKLFNTIRAEVDGRIVEVGAEDGELVEYDQVLFLIEPVQHID